VLGVSTSTAATSPSTTESASTLRARLTTLLFSHTLDLLRKVVERICRGCRALVLDVELGHGLSDSSGSKLRRILLLRSSHRWWL
jgi:hypothetical protein